MCTYQEGDKFMTDILEKMQNMATKVDTAALIARPLHEWIPVLAADCQVFVCGHGFLAKRIDEINYSFCEAQEAKQILVDNIHMLLRYKYFVVASDDILTRISQIVSAMTSNIKSTLRAVTFDKDVANVGITKLVQYLPDGCIAFANGVYDFRNDNWFFKYDIITAKAISNSIYSYDERYIIQWYLNFNFEPLPISIKDTNIEDVLEIFKSLDKDQQNYCFELMYNIAHDSSHVFSIDKFMHLCEILGYTCLNSFCQSFVLLIGAGQNGKNSLFDGCFTNRVVPRPASIDFDTIENDKFVTGSLENKSHNIFLETSAKKYTESKMIKALTGSMYQSIESKGISRYSGIINCKYIFAGNDKELIKFADTTTGFLRRINMLEIFYTWDADKHFLKRGDYYDTSFSDALTELKDDVIHTITFVYLAMMGIAHATKNFTSYFKFTKNEWSYEYADVDMDMKSKLQNILIDKLIEFIDKSDENKNLFESSVFTTDNNRVCKSSAAKLLGLYSAKDFVINNRDDINLGNLGATKQFFNDNDVYVSLRFLQKFLGDISSPMSFTQQVKKMFGITIIPFTYGNKPHVRLTCREMFKLTIVKD